MKKFILFLILCLCWPLSSHAIGPMMMGGGTGATYSCGSLAGTYIFAWTGDFTADTDQACNNSADTVGIAGTLSGTPTISTDYGESGTNGLLIADSADEVRYVTSGDANIDPSVAQTIYARIYITGNPEAVVYFFYGAVVSPDYVQIALHTGGGIWGFYRNATINVSVLSTDTVPTTTWTTIAYSYDPPNGDHSVKIGAGAWKEDVNEITTASTWDATKIGIGNAGYGGDPGASDIYIDKVAVVNGYQASPPSGW